MTTFLSVSQSVGQSVSQLVYYDVCLSLYNHPLSTPNMQSADQKYLFLFLIGFPLAEQQNIANTN